MNFLELAIRVHEEAGLSGSGPSSVVSQTGIAKKVVNWTSASWNEIQSKYDDWKWMWKNDGLVTSVANQREYDISSFSVNNVIRDTFRIRTNGADTSEMPLVWMEYDDFKARLIGVDQVGQPYAVTRTPAGTLMVDPVPADTSYEIRFEYYALPVVLAGNTDTPAMPAKYHEAIVYGALKRYCAHDENLALGQYAAQEYKRWMTALLNEQRPAITIGDPLA